ncbi:MAG TPA: mersacidin/lichenicidin family type 2 lantibiotic [Dongiaceae bacterium]
MNKIDLIRAWKDPLYRSSLTPEELAALPGHPAGLIELSDEQLGQISGAITTALTCTAHTFAGWRSCGCPATTP